MSHLVRQTIINQGSLSKSMKDFEKLSESRKLQNLHYHVLDCGTYTSEHCDPQYFDVLPLGLNVLKLKNAIAPEKQIFLEKKDV